MFVTKQMVYNGYSIHSTHYAIFTLTSQQIQMEILVEKREEFLTAGYVVF